MTASRSTKRDLAQLTFLVLGGGLIVMAGLFTALSSHGRVIWCPMGRAPTRYVPVENRQRGGCTYFLSDEEANSGPDRNDTSWIGYDLGPEPTPLAVGVKWDVPAVPPDPDRRGLVLLVPGLGFVGLSVGMGLWRRRARPGEVSRQ